MFQLLKPEETGVYFQNSISTNDTLNLMNYEYLYNGGGVGIGHFNNDSLPDFFLTSNMGASRIYINKGDFRFTDITSNSGIDTKGKWCTGISVIDINNDGLDDLYISVGGMGNIDVHPNLLYINKGNSTFEEEGNSYGLDDKGESIQSLFFDYDNDGDLDMYLLTGGGFENSAINARPILIDGAGRNTDRLYRNDFDSELQHSYFTDVSRESGINIEGFGLGVSVLDVNNDLWLDVYVSNDYLSRDLLYVNNQDGTFSEKGLDYFGHTSHFSMGNDVGDLDNDGFLDLVTMDMLPDNYKRRKLMSGASSYDFFQIANRLGYGHQHMRNMLQKNNGNGSFSEIGQFSGIARTDWSWAPLIADFDNDGLNDLYVTNGYGKDITDLDFVKFREKQVSTFSSQQEMRKSVIDCLVNRPPILAHNYMFKNNSSMVFENESISWGFEKKSISNGAAYADLDLDGDLDLIINNIDEPTFIYKNRLRELYPTKSNFINLDLIGDSLNINGIGARVRAYSGKNKQAKVIQPSRGFQSTVESTVHFGIGELEHLDSVAIIWPNAKLTTLKNLTANTSIQVQYVDTLPSYKELVSGELWFKTDSIINLVHKERAYNDFGVQPLMMHGFSNQGPGMAVGDLNDDGLQDIFIGGAYGTNSRFLFQDVNGEFILNEIPETELYEDLGALVFDANGDGLNDIYVVSGGSERYEGHEGYQDRLYLNDSKNKGTFTRTTLPELKTSTSTVVGGDFDADGDIDLFVGGRLVVGKYPQAAQSYILENRSGFFVEMTKTICPKLDGLGMVTSAIWSDINNDNHLDLVVVGEFMPVTIFLGNGNELVKVDSENGLQNSQGLWNSIQGDDFDNDGDIDFILGNRGLNSTIMGTIEKPIELHFADFDSNGYLDPILSNFEDGEYRPVASLDQLTSQLPIAKKKVLFYRDFAKASTNDILKMIGNEDYVTLQGKVMSSSYLENLGNGNFELSPLPNEAQFAPVYGILSEDLNGDGLQDVILVGNEYNTEVVDGRYDASFGTILINKGHGEFEVMSSTDTGFFVQGDAKSLVRMEVGENSAVIAGVNDAPAASFKLLTSYKYVEPLANEQYVLVYAKGQDLRKMELHWGQGYLSQSSRNIRVTKNTDSLQFFDYQGNKTRKIRFD
ncbi:MAG: VCBS repeat-containing protein [Maribacter sp.]